MQEKVTQSLDDVLPTMLTGPGNADPAATGEDSKLPSVEVHCLSLNLTQNSPEAL